MTQQLQVEKHHRVLEVGTGSGYQTALLAELAREVFTIEVRAGLSATAQAVLLLHGYSNIEFRIGSGHKGWLEKAPFDRVMVTAAAEDLPTTLFHHMKPDGRMIIPIKVGRDQELFLVTNKNNKPDLTSLVSVRFVPMID